MEARPGPSTMGLSHQGRLVGRRARPSGVNTEEPRQIQKELKTVQPLGAWQTRPEGTRSSQRAASLTPSASRTRGFLSLGRQWESSEDHMDLDSPWLDTGWAGPVPCRQRAVKFKDIHEPGFQQPPRPHRAHLVRDAWHTLDCTNPHKSGCSSQTLLTLGRPWTWLPSMGRGTCPGLQPFRWLGGRRVRVGAPYPGHPF